MKETVCTDESAQFNRSRNVGRNMIFGYINRCVSLLLPFVVRTVVIYRFGRLGSGLHAVPVPAVCAIVDGRGVDWQAWLQDYCFARLSWQLGIISLTVGQSGTRMQRVGL